MSRPPAVTPQPSLIGVDIPVVEPVAIDDPLVDALVRQARDKTAVMDAAKSKDSGR
jgi:hypothetical protein